MAKRRKKEVSHGDVVREVYRDGKLIAQITVDKDEQFWFHMPGPGPWPKWILTPSLDTALKMISILEY